MAKEKKKNDKTSIIFPFVLMVFGILAALIKSDAVFMLFHVIPIPMPVLGVLMAILGLVGFIVGIQEKCKAKKAAKQEEKPVE